MFDVFYFKNPTKLFPHERQANSFEHAAAMSRTRMFWILNYLVDYDQFDFLWEPVPWEAHQRHAWRSQHQVDSGTYLVPRSGYQDTNYRDQVIMRRAGTPLYHIDHGGGSGMPTALRTMRFVGSYLDTLRRLVSTAEHEHIWVTSSMCDYTNFDFSWHPSPWQQDMIHVFASDDQRFGDTFYLHVPTARHQLAQVELLDWANLNFVDQSVPRLPTPVVVHDFDTHVQAVQAHRFTAPLTAFTIDHAPEPLPAISMWRDRTQTVTPLSAGARSVIVPRAAQEHVNTQLYDYPYLSREHVSCQADEPLDIIFLSNGERLADENYQHLLACVPTGHRVTRVSNVQGRVASQHAAARASTTPWYFVITAKLRVNPDFDWCWQPDRLQQPKHYVFLADNPITGLCYGHMAMVAYNRALVLATQGQNLDFTLDQAHEVVNLVSGQAMIGDDPEVLWRTAFREVVKLNYYNSEKPDVETGYRLTQWLNVAEHWTRLGAEAGDAYYKEHSDDFGALRQSYEWQNLDVLLPESARTQPLVV